MPEALTLCLIPPIHPTCAIQDLTPLVDFPTFLRYSPLNSSNGGALPGALLARRTEDGMEPDDLLCSRNARPQKALVGHAQWKINQPPSQRGTSKLGGNMYIVRCAQLRATLATPLYMVGGKERECRSGDSLCSRNARSWTPLVGRAHDGNPQGRPSDAMRRRNSYGSLEMLT